ncbi:hypothetical protein KIL84_022307 [Mauremys mutica]|uniref:Uncharacterized protein n=1 Tax=Mauremys mutica TaxID=74926 RepID=A0A9D4ATL3_9SAUR|nr:hypothetical protein KIL84_022307 [Mauremys mutica]
MGRPRTHTQHESILQNVGATPLDSLCYVALTSRCHLPIKVDQNSPTALFACKGLSSKMLTYCLLLELNISRFSSHLKEVSEQYSQTVQTNKTFPFARKRNPVYSIKGRGGIFSEVCRFFKRLHCSCLFLKTDF